MRTTIRLLSVLVILLLLVGPVSAQGTVKPALIVKAEGTAYSVGDNGGDIWAAQSFTGVAGMLGEFGVTLGESSGFPDGTITYQIRTDDHKLPGGEILAEGDFEAKADADNAVTVDDVPILSASKTYWLVLMTTEPQYAKDYWTWQVSTRDVYKGGRFLYSGNEGYNWNDDSIDAQFSVTVIPALKAP